MNSVNLTGRLTRDPEVRYGGNGESCVARFTVACDRKFKREGAPSADFISCVAFGKTAEFIEKWFKKGMKMEITGRIQTGSYEDSEGTKRYTTDVVAETVSFAESRSAASNNEGSPSNEGGFAQAAPDPMEDQDGFVNIPDGIDEELPFH